MNEDEPMEREAAIDPGMLGKVFATCWMLPTENLRERSTPREITLYVSGNSYKSFITKTGIPEADIRILLYTEI